MEKLNPEADQNNDQENPAVTTDDKNDAVQCGCKKMHAMLVRGLIGIVLGGLVGFGLYRYVGCPDGTCLITSSPWGSVLYCAILGFVVSQIVRPCRVA